MNIGSIDDIEIEIVRKVGRDKSAERRSCVNVDWNVFVPFYLMIFVMFNVRSNKQAVLRLRLHMRWERTLENCQCLSIMLSCVHSSWSSLLVINDECCLLGCRRWRVQLIFLINLFERSLALCTERERQNWDRTLPCSIFTRWIFLLLLLFLVFLTRRRRRRRTETTMTKKRKRRRRRKKSRQRREQKGKEQKRSLFVYLVSTQIIIIIISGKTSRLRSLSLSLWLSLCLNRKISSVWPLQLAKRNGDDDERRNRSIGSERLWARQRTH